MKIYLNPQHKSGLGEDTFWTWFERVIPSEFVTPDTVPNPEDIVLQYGTLGPWTKPGRAVALPWELHAEMFLQLRRYRRRRLLPCYNNLMSCYENSYASSVSSRFCLEWYPKSTILPIAVNTELFFKREGEEREAIRQRRGYSPNEKIGVWCGTTHEMKGLDIAKAAESSGELPGKVVYVMKGEMQQEDLAELMSVADYAVFSGRLRPFFMFEWEAMAADLEIVDISPHKDNREFKMDCQNPRHQIFEHGWDRLTAVNTWRDYLENL